MRARNKRELIDQLNLEFENLLAKKEKAKYSKYVRSITEDIVTKQPKNRQQMQKIIRNKKLDTKTATRMFSVLANVSSLIMAPPASKQQANKLEPLQAVMRAYSVTNPKSFANNVYNMTTGQNMSKRNERFRPAVLSYYEGFTENIETADQQAQRALARGQLESKSAMFKDLEDLREQRVPLRQQKTLLLEKYANPMRVERALNTELHEQAERTKMEVSKFMRYTHKEWNTQRDERVRKTRFHQQVDRKRIPIDSKWKVGREEAEYPGDMSLSAGERINCRCYVTYFNSPDENVSAGPIIRPAAAEPIAPAPKTTKTLVGEKQEKQKDTEERTLSKEQQEYFKDSKIKNEDGELVRLYHGSIRTDITEFSTEFAGRGSGVPENLMYFTDNRQTAVNFSAERVETDSAFIEETTGKFGKVYEVYLDMQNPLDLNDLKEKDIDVLTNLIGQKFNIDKDRAGMLFNTMRVNQQQLKTFIDDDVLREYGYDGLKAEMEPGSGVFEYGVLNSSQIRMVEDTKPLTPAKGNTPNPRVVEKYKKQYDTWTPPLSTESPQSSANFQRAVEEIKPQNSNMFKNLIEEMKYDDPPEIINKETLKNRLIEGKGTLVTRGYTGKSKEQTLEYRRDMESGQFYVDNEGGSAYGRGMYTGIAMRPEETTNWNINGINTAKEYAQTYEEQLFNRPPEKGQIDVMYLSEDFKVINEEQIKKIQNQKLINTLKENRSTKAVADIMEKTSRVIEQAKSAKGKKQDELLKEELTLRKQTKQLIDSDPEVKNTVEFNRMKYNQMDPANIAMTEGYDGYQAFDDSYLIILNRSKVQLLDNYGEDAETTYRETEKLIAEVGKEREKRKK